MSGKTDLLIEITATYRKFGWTLRRVLLTENTRRDLQNTLNAAVFKNVSVSPSEIDAIWFSRLSGEREAWELRSLSAAPFALLELFDKNTDDARRGEQLRILEQKMMTSRAKFSV